MELTFTRQGGRYVSQEVAVDGDYNVHLELSAPGMVGLEQRTAGNDFDQVILPKEVSDVYDRTFDFDFQHLVYPKTVRVTSLAEVKTGIITTAQ